MIGKHAYRLELPDDWVGVHPVFHVSLLQSAFTDLEISRPAPPVPIISVNDEAEE